MTQLERELLSALRILVEHAQETYPHFESPRGQADIALALYVISKADAQQNTQPKDSIGE